MQRFWPAVLGWLLLIGGTQRLVADHPSELVFEGERLFNHEWKRGDPLSPNGDGLGPVFNASSCVACHHDGGRGGSGGLEHNAAMVSLEAAPADPDVDAPQISGRLRGLRGINQIFTERASASFILHHESTRATYGVWRSQMTAQPDGTVVGKTSTPFVGGSQCARSALTRRRNTPTLFGNGLIDQIRAETLQQVAAAQPRKTRGRITGRIAPNVGRFGWPRANHESTGICGRRVRQ